MLISRYYQRQLGAKANKHSAAELSYIVVGACMQCVMNILFWTEYEFICSLNIDRKRILTIFDIKFKPNMNIEYIRSLKSN